MRQRTVKGACTLVIPKSDLVIMTVATCALALGIFRWHQNTQNVSVVTIPASSTSDIVVATPIIEVEEPKRAEVIVAAVPEESQPTIVIQEPEVPEYLDYTVVYGDSLSVIAQRHNTSVATLQRLNSINGTTIRVGQTLRYPNPAR